MDDEGMLVGRKEGRKEKLFNAFLAQMPPLHGLNRLWFEQTIF